MSEFAQQPLEGWRIAASLGVLAAALLGLAMALGGGDPPPPLPDEWA